MIVDNGKYYLYRHIRLDKNEPFYIGIGTKSKNDINTHSFYRANSNLLRNRFWHFVVEKTKYGVEIMLQSNDKAFILEKEIEFIKLYGRRDKETGSLVNLTDGGEGCLNCKQSQEQINKRKETIKKLIEKRGYFHSEETKKKLSIRHTGKKMSEEAKKKMSIATIKRFANSNRLSKNEKYRLNKDSLGRLSKEEKRIISLKNLEGVAEKNKKPVIQLDKNLVFIKEWKSIKEAATKLNINKHHIGQVCKNKRKSSGGYKWKYKC